LFLKEQDKMSGICLSNKKLLLLAISATLIASCAPYHAQKGATSFRQQGQASWYGPGFQGRKTASGERFNTGAMTAAHRTLPFGTTVRVTNLSNGKSALVRINDRGPFAHGRIIDLSKAAAREVGLLGAGTAAVEIRAVGPGKETEERLLLASKGSVTRNGVEHLISVETGATPEDKTIDSEDEDDDEGDEDSKNNGGAEKDDAGFDGTDSKETSYNTNDTSADEEEVEAPVVKKAPKQAKKQPKEKTAQKEESYSVDSEPF
jgi:rare lipoprotein A